MKYPVSLKLIRLASALSLFCVFATAADARIGESRSEIERRLNSAGGIVYRDDAIAENRMKGMPYVDYLMFFENSADVRVYFKTSDGRNPKQSELESRRRLPGWDLHVVYVEGESKIEVYDRSSSLTEFELNALLARHAEGSYWKKANKRKQSDGGEDPPPSAFGFNMVRADGEVRAKRIGGDKVLFVETAFDARLAEVKEADLVEKAPVSVEGF